jgi:hypothetical protein
MKVVGGGGRILLRERRDSAVCVEAAEATDH